MKKVFGLHGPAWPMVVPAGRAGPRPCHPGHGTARHGMAHEFSQGGKAQPSHGWAEAYMPARPSLHP